jgi:hypothetical protein
LQVLCFQAIVELRQELLLNLLQRLHVLGQRNRAEQLDREQVAAELLFDSRELNLHRHLAPVMQNGAMNLGVRSNTKQYSPRKEKKKKKKKKK